MMNHHHLLQLQTHFVFNFTLFNLILAGQLLEVDPLFYCFYLPQVVFATGRLSEPIVYFQFIFRLVFIIFIRGTEQWNC